MFSELELFMNQTIPSDIKHILIQTSFENELSLLGIDDEIIADIELYVNENKDILKNTSYEKVEVFKFKPGHKTFILQMANQVKQKREEKTSKSVEFESNEFSHILKAYIDTAQANKGRHPNGFRYNEINRFFSTFIYLLCGKACYETLSSNLPIPKADTIRKR